MRFKDLKPGDYFTSPDLIKGIYLKVEDKTGNMRDKVCYIFCKNGTLHCNYSDDFPVQLTDQEGNPIERKIMFSELKHGDKFKIPKVGNMIYTKLLNVVVSFECAYFDEHHNLCCRVSDFLVNPV